MEKLKYYKHTFLVPPRGLQISPRTTVDILDLRTVPAPTTYYKDNVRVEAYVQLSIEIVLAKGHLHNCAGCGMEPPLLNSDVMWYLLENVGAGKITAPGPESLFDQPDTDRRYPVPGWREIDDKLLCTTCANKVSTYITTELKK